MSTQVETLVNKEYKHGWVTDIESDVAPKGLSEDIVRLISAKKREPDWLLDWRLKAYRGWLKMTEPHSWPNIKYTPVDYQSIRYYSAPRTKNPLGSLDEVGPEAARDLREARHPALRAEDPRGRGGGCHLRLGLGGHHLQGQAGRAGDHLLLLRRGGAGAPRAGAEVSRLGRPVERQLLRRAQRGRVQRRVVRLRPQGRALPDGAVHLLPDQYGRDGTVRADPHHRRRRRLRELPRGLHRAQAGREPAPRRGGRAGRAGRRHYQVLDGAELVCRRRGGQGRDLQLRDQARQVRRGPVQDLVDPGRDRLRDHLEVPQRHPPGRRLRGRVLLGRGGERAPAGRHRHQDDPHRKEHPEHDRLEGNQRGAGAEQLPRAGEGAAEGCQARATTPSAIRC